MTTREIKNIEFSHYDKLERHKSQIILGTVMSFYSKWRETVKSMNPDYTYNHENNSIVLSVGEERVIDGFATTVLDNLEECILRELKLV
jgi:hypothetical protein